MSVASNVYMISIVMLFMVLGACVLWGREDMSAFKRDCMLATGLFLIVIWVVVGAYIASSPSSTSPVKSNSVTTKTTKVLDQNNFVVINRVRYYP